MIIIYVCMLSICVGFLAVFIGDVIIFFKHKDEYTEEGAAKFINKNYKFDGEKWVSNDLETNKILADCIYYILDYMAKEGVVDEEKSMKKMMKLMDEIAREGGVILKQNGGKNGSRR